MAPGGEMFRYPQHFGENVLRHGSHEWLPYSKNEVRLQSSNTNLSFRFQLSVYTLARREKNVKFPFPGQKNPWSFCRNWAHPEEIPRF